jgi:hypothetical protein
MTKNPNSRRPRSTFPSNTVRLASLLVVIVTIMGLGALAYFTERGIGVSRDWGPPTYQGRSQLGDLQLEIMRAHANETAYVLTAGQSKQSISARRSRLIWRGKSSPFCETGFVIILRSRPCDVDEYGKRSQVKVSRRVDEPMERWPRDVEIVSFRVLQETLTNVHRQAAAKVVDVQIVQRDGCDHWTVSDDEKGIPEDVLSKFRGEAAPDIGSGGNGRTIGGIWDKNPCRSDSNRPNWGAEESFRFCDPRLTEAGCAEGNNSRTPIADREPIAQ